MSRKTKKKQIKSIKIHDKVESNPKILADSFNFFEANIAKHLNFRISGQRVERINEVKYLGLVVNKILEWRTHFTQLKKLTRAIGLLSKIRHPHHKIF